MDGDTPTTAYKVSQNTLYYAAIIVAILPFMAAYPFLQKYFVQGVNVGAVVTSLIASLDKGISGKKVIFVKFITRTLTLIPAIIIAFIFKNKLIGIVGTSDGKMQIALAHFAFNLLSAIIFVPLLP